MQAAQRNPCSSDGPAAAAGIFSPDKKISGKSVPEGYKKSSQRCADCLCFSDLGGARTLDPMIKSHLLYQLSYEVISV